jgi:hypothetical protein
MSLLTDDEKQTILVQWLQDDGSYDEIGLIEAAEKSLMAKLASAELPEPALPTHAKGRMFSEEQFNQAFAQGAASQLSAEPFTHYRHYDEQVQPFADENTVPLYTRKEAQ